MHATQFFLLRPSMIKPVSLAFYYHNDQIKSAKLLHVCDPVLNCHSLSANVLNSGCIMVYSVCLEFILRCMLCNIPSNEILLHVHTL